MNTYKEEYDARKAKVVQYLTGTIEFLEKQEETADTINALEKYRKNVEENLFSIVLVGEFSVGKSKFLNALMHRYILPSYTAETTATVNFLRHTSQAPDHEEGIVYYKDGRKETLSELTRETLERVVCTRGDTDDVKVATSIDHVDLFLDSPFLEDGVMLVDSPGLNGVADHHREITEQQIKASNASIFMFSANQPGSKTDFEYLKYLKSQSGRVFLVLNMIDVIDPSQGETVEDVINKLKGNYLKQFPEEKTLPEIWPVSAEAALVARDDSIGRYKNVEEITTKERREELEKESRMEEFEQRLWQYLTQGERSREQMLGPVNRCLTILEERRSFFQKQITLLNEEQSVEELQAQKIALEDEIRTLQKERRKISPDLLKKVNEALDDAQNRGSAGCVQVKKEIKAEVEGSDSPDDLLAYSHDLPRLLSIRCQRIGTQMQDALRDDLLRIVEEEFDTWFDELEERMGQNIGQLEIPLNVEKLNLTPETISSNMARFEEWCAGKRKEIEEMEASAEKLEEDSMEARIAAKRIEAANEDMRSLRERLAYLQDNFVIPDAVHYQKEVHDEVKRKGLLGFFGNILFGKKSVVHQETVTDDSRKRAAEKQQEEQKKELQEEINDLKKRLRELSYPEKDSEFLAKKAEKIRLKQMKAEQEYENRQHEFMEEMQENAEKACRNMRKKILLYVEEVQEDYLHGLGIVLKRMKSGCIDAVRDLLNVNLDQQLEHTQQKLAELINLIDTKGEERAQKLNFAIEQEKSATDLIMQGNNLSAALEKQMNDHVKQEVLK